MEVRLLRKLLNDALDEPDEKVRVGTFLWSLVAKFGGLRKEMAKLLDSSYKQERGWQTIGALNNIQQ